MLSIITVFLLLCLSIIAYNSINPTDPIDPCYPIKFRHHPACKSPINTNRIISDIHVSPTSLQKICYYFIPKPVNTTEELFSCYILYNASLYKNDINDAIFKTAFYEFNLLSRVNNVHNKNDKVPQATFNYMYRRTLENQLENSYTENTASYMRARLLNDVV